MVNSVPICFLFCARLVFTGILPILFLIFFNTKIFQARFIKDCFEQLPILQVADLFFKKEIFSIK